MTRPKTKVGSPPPGDPTEVYRPAPLSNWKHFGHDPLNLGVVHTTEGGCSDDLLYQAALNWFMNPKAEVSAHFLIDWKHKPGKWCEITRLLPRHAEAYAALSANASVKVAVELAARASYTRAEWLEKHDTQLWTLAWIWARQEESDWQPILIQHNCAPGTPAHPPFAKGWLGHRDLNAFGWPQTPHRSRPRLSLGHCDRKGKDSTWLISRPSRVYRLLRLERTVSARKTYADGMGVTFTLDDLASAIEAVDDPHIQAPRLKLGHVDEAQEDSLPAFGIVENMRLENEGHTLVADFAGVPEWLAEVIPTAWPSRSVEAANDVKTQSGEYSMVISRVALLGVQMPGVTSLDDMEKWFEAEQPEGVLIVME